MSQHTKKLMNHCSKYFLAFVLLLIGQLLVGQVDTLTNEVDTTVLDSSQIVIQEDEVVQEPVDPLSNLNYANPQEFRIAGIRVEGGMEDPLAVKLRSGLAQGDQIKVPGDEITNAIKKLWDSGIFSDVQIYAEEIQDQFIFLVIKIKQKPKVSEFKFNGVRKSERSDLEEMLAPFLKVQISPNLEFRIKKIVKGYFKEKGRMKVDVKVYDDIDSLNQVSIPVKISVDKGPKVRIKEIKFKNNLAITDFRLRKSMKETKQKVWWNPFRGAKYIEDLFKDDKRMVIQEYRRYGFRDAKILKDSIYYTEEDRVVLVITMDEGDRYYYRDIQFEGNTKYTDKQLKKILSIEKGDIYNEEQLMRKLTMDPQGGDVSSLYLDDGYLFFNVIPTEVKIENDSIDLLINIYEGKQAVIGEVTIVGNTKTSDYVVLRELYTKPGELFKRSDIIRSQRELANLQYFNPETMQVNPKPNPATGTVDIEYVLEEQPSDQFELQGGYGAGRLVGTLGLSFNNFSTKKFFDASQWNPIPSGDGQTLTLRAQSSGRFFQSYNFSFVEPWWGGKKPRALSFSVYHTRLNSVSTDGHQYITGVNLGLGNRLKWPDNFFRANISAGYQRYDVKNYPGLDLAQGQYNNGNLKLTISRNSIDQPIYPKSGVEMQAIVQATLPIVSLQNADKSFEDIQKLADSEKFRWIEYHKYRFHFGWYNKLVEKLVLYNRVNFGVMASYNKALGISPFERFYMGGSGLTGFNIDGREIIPMRGYEEANQTNVVYEGDGVNGGVAAVKYTMELRYPLSLQPAATIYGLGFFEAGNTYSRLSEFDPFNVNRTVGAGIRLYLPMIGMLGFDYGFPFDPANPNDFPELFQSVPGQFTFTFGGNLSGW